jgi:tRNA modification GTPase
VVQQDTVFALSSGRPPAAIAVIRISGPAAFEAAKALSGSLPAPRAAALRGLRRPDTGELLDEALVLCFAAPASATGEDVVELHCHGGRAVVDAVLASLQQHPRLRAATPGEFTRRAFHNGRIDLTAAEGLADLLEAETESQRKVALALAGGALRQQIDAWQEQLLSMSAMAERAIDYVDDDSDDGVEAELHRSSAALAAELNAWLARPRMEPLKDGVRVVIAGPPNAGKSSLLNVMVGQERSIVTDVPGTTRDHVDVPLALAGVPLLLTDTAGVRKTDDKVEAIGVARAARLSEAADILLWTGDANAAPPHPRLVLVQSKVDLAGGQINPEAIPVSARTGAGLSALLERVASMAKALLPREDEPALNRRQAQAFQEAAEALHAASEQTDIILLTEDLRSARNAFDRLTGRAGIEDVLDALFGRFCLGK